MGTGEEGDDGQGLGHGRVGRDGEAGKGEGGILRNGPPGEGPREEEGGGKRGRAMDTEIERLWPSNPKRYWGTCGLL